MACDERPSPNRSSKPIISGGKLDDGDDPEHVPLAVPQQHVAAVGAEQRRGVARRSTTGRYRGRAIRPHDGRSRAAGRAAPSDAASSRTSAARARSRATASSRAAASVVESRLGRPARMPPGVVEPIAEPSPGGPRSSQDGRRSGRRRIVGQPPGVRRRRRVQARHRDGRVPVRPDDEDADDRGAARHRTWRATARRRGPRRIRRRDRRSRRRSAIEVAGWLIDQALLMRPFPSGSSPGGANDSGSRRPRRCGLAPTMCSYVLWVVTMRIDAGGW